MRFDTIHWRRGAPQAPGNYYVFDRQRGRIEWAVITGVEPLFFRTGRASFSGTWPFSAYLGPLGGPRNGQ